MEAQFHHGAAGVWNPVSQQVEWKSLFQSGAAGYFDHEQGKVIWHEESHSGVCIVITDAKTGDHLTCCGGYPNSD